MPFLLRRTGARPLRGFGRQVAAADSRAEADDCRLTLLLYRTEPAGYVAAMSCEPASGAPWHQAQACATLEAAVVAFETALPLTTAPASAPVGNAAAALQQAARSVCREAAVEHAFRALVGVFLHRLCTHGLT
jgi:hypothetical protein